MSTRKVDPRASGAVPKDLPNNPSAYYNRKEESVRVRPQVYARVPQPQGSVGSLMAFSETGSDRAYENLPSDVQSSLALDAALSLPQSGHEAAAAFLNSVEEVGQVHQRPAQQDSMIFEPRLDGELQPQRQQQRVLPLPAYQQRQLQIDRHASGQPQVVLPVRHQQGQRLQQVQQQQPPAPVQQEQQVVVHVGDGAEEKETQQ